MNTRKTILLMTFVLLNVVLFAASNEVSKNKKTRILLAGDSTMQDVNHNDSTKLDWGWGQVLPRFFDENVEIKNFAKGGRSTRSFTSEGRWDKLIDEAGAGDYIFIQFGHNDSSKSKGERYTTPEQYRDYLVKFVNESREKGAIPVLITPVSRRKFVKGDFVGSHGEYPDIVKDVAKKMDVPLIDLELKSADLLKKYGEEKSKTIFIHLPANINPVFPEGKEDNTHFSEFGATEIAKLVVQSLKELKIKELNDVMLVY